MQEGDWFVGGADEPDGRCRGGHQHQQAAHGQIPLKPPLCREDELVSFLLHFFIRSYGWKL